MEYLFTLTTFDTTIETPYLGVPIDKVDGEELKKHGPRAATALYDAVGKTLQAIDDDKNLTFEKAIVVIVTDGQENSTESIAKQHFTLPLTTGSSAETGPLPTLELSLRHGTMHPL